MRYLRQATLIGKTNQKKLESSTITVVGLGAIGTNTASLLARAGINLILIDNDTIELNNLQRQTLYSGRDIGKSKVLTAKDYLKKINSKIKIKAYNLRLNKNNLDLLDSDLILDCTDNLKTRFLINEFAIKNNIPWIYAAAIKDKASLLVVIPNKTPCFNCIFKRTNNLENCQSAGILPSTASLISSIQVSEAIKVLLNKDYEKNLLHIDLFNNQIVKTKVKKKKNCNICKKEFKKEKISYLIQKCDDNKTIKIQPDQNLNLNFKKIKEKFNVINKTPILLVIKDKYKIIVYKNGKLLIKNCKNKKFIKEFTERLYKYM